MTAKKLRIAIFDLTDCEGCELQFLVLREKLAHAGHDFEIDNWRLGTSQNFPGPYDITFIEGSPITEDDVETVKRARAISGTIVTLGSCAHLGGVQASLTDHQRTSALKEMYGEKYKKNTKTPRPVSYYVPVDIALPGCPVNTVELERLLICLFNGKKFIPAYYPVCLDCKVAKNDCLFLEDGYCLGPVTKGGCGAPCPKAGLRCYGCFGPIKDARLGALSEASPELTEAEIEKSLALFMKHSEEYKKYRTEKRGKK